MFTATGRHTEGQNLALSPQEMIDVELITTPESTIRRNNRTEMDTEQLRIKVTATLSNN